MNKSEIVEKIDELSNDELSEIFVENSTRALKSYKSQIEELPFEAISTFEDISMSYLASLALVNNLYDEIATLKNEKLLHMNNLSTLNKLENRAKKLYESQDLSSIIQMSNLDLIVLLSDYCKSSCTSHLDLIIKSSIINLILGQITQPRGRKKLDISDVEIFKEFKANGENISATANKFEIDRKTVRNRINGFRLMEENPLLHSMLDDILKSSEKP